MRSTALSEDKNIYNAESRDSNSEREKLTTRGMVPRTSRVSNPVQDNKISLDIDSQLVEIPKMVNRAQQTSQLSKYLADEASKH